MRNHASQPARDASSELSTMLDALSTGCIDDGRMTRCIRSCGEHVCLPSLARLAATALCGRVWARELAEGPGTDKKKKNRQRRRDMRMRCDGIVPGADGRKDFGKHKLAAPHLTTRDCGPPGVLIQSDKNVNQPNQRPIEKVLVRRWMRVRLPPKHEANPIAPLAWYPRMTNSVFPLRLTMVAGSVRFNLTRSLFFAGVTLSRQFDVTSSPDDLFNSFPAQHRLRNRTVTLLRAG